MKYKGKLDLNNKVLKYYWNYENGGTGNNDWSQSNLNKTNLNEFYLNYIQVKDDGKWHNMIEEHTWITAGNTTASIQSKMLKLHMTMK